MIDIKHLYPVFSTKLYRTGEELDQLGFDVECTIDVSMIQSLKQDKDVKKLLSEVVGDESRIIAGHLNGVIFCNLTKAHEPDGGYLSDLANEADAISADHEENLSALFATGNHKGIKLRKELEDEIASSRVLPKGVASIERIVVMDCFQGQGVGQGLMREFSLMTRHLYDFAVLTVSPLNRSGNVEDYLRLRKFYHRLGFQEFDGPIDSLFALPEDLGRMRFNYKSDKKVIRRVQEQAKRHLKNSNLTADLNRILTSHNHQDDESLLVEKGLAKLCELVDANKHKMQ